MHLTLSLLAKTVMCSAEQNCILTSQVIKILIINIEQVATSKIENVNIKKKDVNFLFTGDLNHK